MLVNFLLMCIALVALPKKNPVIASNIKVLVSSRLRNILALAGIVFLSLFLTIHVWKDMTSAVSNWYFHTTYVWLIVMTIASLIYFWQLRKLTKKGKDWKEIFKKLPTE
ncbi:MAG: hypothetical protein R2822_00565 [Spirosomataceae bacterium]